jgi:hypothetical protein
MQRPEAMPADLTTLRRANWDKRYIPSVFASA